MAVGLSGERAEVRLVDLSTDYDPALLTEFYTTVMVPSFAEPELVPLPLLQDALAAPDATDTQAVLALTPDGHAVGGIIGEWYRYSEVLLLAYLAVRRDLRGRGIATRLMDEGATKWYASLKPLLAVGEVDDPRHFAVDADRGDPAARLRLYERAGARLLAMPYFQPEIEPGRGRMHRMLLLAFHVDPKVRRVHRMQLMLDGQVVGRFLREYFTACEGEATLRDPELGRLLELVVRPEGVALLPIDRYREVASQGPPPV